MRWAWSALEVARAFEREPAVAGATGLPAIIYRATRQESILAASRLASSDQESITLHYLVDHARQHPQIFRRASGGRLRQMLTQWEQGWQSWQAFAERLRAYRDRRLAHMDRKALNEPEVLSNLEISLESLAGLLQHMLDTLTAIYELYYNETLNLEPMRRVIRRQARRLVADLRAQAASIAD